MWIAYVDEAGTAGTLPAAESPIEPVFVIGAVIIDERHLVSITREFLELKQRFFPNRVRGHHLDAILHEIKGSELRRQVGRNRRERRHALGFLDKTLACLDAVDARIVGRVWVKEVGADHRAKSIYTSSLQSICGHFQHWLQTHGGQGVVIADSRCKHENVNVSHSLFTQKYRAQGDPLHRIVEMPTFGHSENHVGLQFADLVCSALIFPIACYAYCTGYVDSVHVRPEYQVLQDRYGQRVKERLYLYRDVRGRTSGGITVSDPLAKRHSGHLLTPIPTVPPLNPLGDALGSSKLTAPKA